MAEFRRASRCPGSFAALHGSRADEEKHRRRAYDTYDSLLRETPNDPDVLRPYLSNAAALAGLLPADRKAELCRQSLESRADLAGGALADPEVLRAYEELRESCRH
jgi:hypothetical protein